MMTLTTPTIDRETKLTAAWAEGPRTTSRTGCLVPRFSLTQGITFAGRVLAIRFRSWEMADTHPSALAALEHKRVGIAKLACQEFETPYRNSKETAS